MIEDKESAMSRLRFVLLALVMLGLAACGGATCYDEDPEYFDAAEDIDGRWDDLILEAAATPRIAFGGVVGDMSALIREFENLEPPDCAASYHAAQTNALEMGLAAMLIFASGDETYDASLTGQVVRNARAEALHELGIVHGTPPAPSPTPGLP